MIAPEKINPTHADGWRSKQGLAHDNPPPQLAAGERVRLIRQHHEWIAHIALHALAGFILGAIAVFLIVWLDINRIGSMIFHSSKPLMVIVLMIAGFGSTFGMVAAGTAIYFKSTEN